MHSGVTRPPASPPERCSEVTSKVEFENNLVQPDGTIARSNAELVVAVATALEACACDLADADELRRAWSFLTE